MRVAFLSWRDLSNPAAGGSEVVVDRLAGGLIDLGHEVSLVCGGPVSAIGEHRPYQVIEAGGTYSQYARVPIECWRRLRGYDILVDVENGVPYFSPLWWAGARICFVHHVHQDQWGMHFGQAPAALGRFLEGRMMPVAYRHDLFVGVSSSTASALADLKVDPRSIRVIPNGVDLPPEASPLRSGEPVFAVVGRLVAHKRVEFILKAWQEVHAEVGGTLVVVGDGPERKRLQAIAGPGVEWRGRVGEMEKDEILGKAWLLVHAAHHEGWGMVAAEAASHGTPTLAMDAPGIRDVVIDSSTGVLVDSPQALADQWVALVLDRKRRQRLGAAARARSETMSWAKSVLRLEEVLSEAIERRRRRLSGVPQGRFR